VSSGPELDRTALERTRLRTRARLLEERHPAGHWEGELSSSALSTATAALALTLAARAGVAGARHEALAARGRAWLAAHQNADGGWGDTRTSPSNPSTTALSWTALGLAPEDFGEPLRRAEARLTALAGTLEPRALAQALLAAYGDDRTFSVPILVACALGGRLGPEESAWSAIPALPFELAALPRGLFRSLGLPMVSYALPALIAIGQVLHARHPTANPVARLARNAARARTLRTLEEIQPSSGGFLEATPLTSFVVASLVGAGAAHSTAVAAGVRFLEQSVREDGSWPIDTNLATWLTSLAVDALAGGDELEATLPADERGRIAEWLARQQLARVHPYTLAAPGGWAWTDLPGGVPDADDTSGALVALAHLRATPPAGWNGADAGAAWLLGLQNRDGGIPTFCRGWSGLPFDESCADLTAHALRAFAAWDGRRGRRLEQRVVRARVRAERFLLDGQRADGSWVPLWFGSQAVPALENPLYGTTRVLKARGTLGPGAAAALGRAEGWLLAAQNEDGGFGGARGVPSSIEETGLALEALATAAPSPAARSALERAAAWLVRHTQEGERFEATPIGLYFAKLWYSEKLYPMLFALSALERTRARLAPSAARVHHA